VLSARSFAIVANGFADGPAQALRDYLVDSGAEVVAVSHPLTREDGTRHSVVRFHDGKADARDVSVPLRPPASYLVDPLIPLLPPRVEAWFGFNPLACGRGLLARATRRAERVILWSVDFVPDRFGAGTAATRIYDVIDRRCCSRSDARVELSRAALEGRNARHGLEGTAAHAHVVPMGAWLDRVPTTPADGHSRRRVAFLGHLVPRQGVETLLAAVALVKDRGGRLSVDVIGTGPLEAPLRERARSLGLDDVVTFHGFVPDHRRVEQLLADASVGMAPYVVSEESFTRYADPGKLKAYLAAGLPIVLTDVPPNAHELAAEAGAQVVAHDADALASAIEDALSSPERWQQRREAALAYARRFDWARLLPDLLDDLELNPRTKPTQ
jgi:glycosyltransferase involved in cell wall biosynthesis